MSARDLLDGRWPYDSPSRRRGRAVRRLAEATVRSGSLRPGILPTYWWDGHPNFGDALTPWILSRYGIAAVHTQPQDARVAGVGSIIEQLPPSFSGTIWGSGLMHGGPVKLPQATALAVRGPLTKSALGITHDIALGDPGILVAHHAAPQKPRWRLGVVPHGLHSRDQALADLAARAGSDVTVIDVRAVPGAVIHRIAQCSVILTTSLHGLIVADALGVPAVWTRRQPDLWGGDFKFRDYEAVMTPGRSREIALTGDTSLRDLELGANGPDALAREESIRRLEETIPRLPMPPGRPWQALAWRRGRLGR